MYLSPNGAILTKNRTVSENCHVGDGCDKKSQKFHGGESSIFNLNTI
jgi:hypothetical protein